MEKAQETSQEPSVESLLGTYSEVCKSYHAVDEFRMKLLGLLPLASLAGIIILKKEDVLTNASTGNELVGFAGLFAAAFTLALFIYEIRGIVRCDNLIKRGHEIEKEMNVRGQFFICQWEHEKSRRRSNRFLGLAGFFNSKVAACVIYSVVLTAWVFVALRYGYGVKSGICAASALLSGFLLAGVSFTLVRRLIAA